MCWLHAGPEPLSSQSVPSGVSAIANVVDAALENVHSQSLASVLATAIKRLGCDAVFCGVLSHECGTGSTGGAIAAQLKIPFVAQAHAVAMHGDQFHVSIHGATMLATVATPWPCVIACVPSAAGLPTLMHSPVVQTFTLDELGIVKQSLRRGLDLKREHIHSTRSKSVKSGAAFLGSVCKPTAAAKR